MGRQAHRISDQLYAWMVMRIKELPEGARLWSMKELESQFDLSRWTTQRVCQRLKKEGVIVTRPGNGMFKAGGEPQLAKKASETPKRSYDVTPRRSEPSRGGYSVKIVHVARSRVALEESAKNEGYVVRSPRNTGCWINEQVGQPFTTCPACN